MAAPDFRFLQVFNDHSADTIYPQVYDQSGEKLLWDGSAFPDFAITPSKHECFHLVQHYVVTGRAESNKKIDFNSVPNPINNQTIVTFAVQIQGTDKVAHDLNNKRTYINTSQKTAVGHFAQNETFNMDVALAAAELDPLAFQEAYLKLSAPALAKLLISVANLISPEVYI